MRLWSWGCRCLSSSSSSRASCECSSVSALEVEVLRVREAESRVTRGPLAVETVDRIRTRALGDPSDHKARMVPLYRLFLFGGE
ncbi:hypothetical protein E2C01_073250 [Portunus trituberculatus]|uniref:Uncharacterized protein n=1 Tax=Portunus trituberculatus TaxID=210409 RepID=A0A5B7I8Y3_PORTR|nr:hypothetical protein [Portunus trituberculatus]